MGTSWRVEGPLDIALKKIVVDLTLVPTVDCIAQLLLAPHKVASVVGTHLFG